MNLEKKQGMTLRTLAQKSGISKTAISNIERGITNPRIDTMSMLAETLGVSVSELLRQRKSIKASDYPQKTKEEYMAELQDIFTKMDAQKVRYFYILTLAKLGVTPKGGVLA